MKYSNIFTPILISFYSEIIREEEVPKDMRAQVEDSRQELIEHVSNVDDTLGELFLGMDTH
jgi:elongation factor G